MEGSGNATVGGGSISAPAAATHRQPPPALIEFCQREHPRLVGALTLYIGDNRVAEEIAQEALLAACRSWSRVSRMDAPGAWVHRAAMNIANSHFRRLRAERRAIGRRGAERDRYDLPDVPGAVMIREAVARLPRDQRAVLLLRFGADLSVQDTAHVMDRSPDAVRALTHRAVVALREYGLDVDPGAHDGQH